MKHYILIAAAAIALAACSKDNTEPATTTSGQQLSQRTITVEGTSNTTTGWMFTDYKDFPGQEVAENGSYFFHSEHMADFITDDVCANGKVDIYMYAGVSQSKLPYTRHYLDPATKKIWTTTIDFVYAPGYVHIYYTRNDFPDTLTAADNPGQQKFRVVVSSKN